MFKVEIISHLYDPDDYIPPENRLWWDHTGKTENKIDKFVFSKKYYEIYEPGCYPIESFGSLYRNIDNFCESPIQALTDWEITIPSIYSSKDGSFSTVDLIYHLEAINEEMLEKNEENYSEFLIGCEAVLYEDDNIIYRGVVNSISSSGGSTSISIGERIGSSEIKQSKFPLPLGNAGVLYWPVEIEVDEFNRSFIKISERTLSRFDGFYVNLGKNGGYILVNLDLPNQEVLFSSGFTEVIFIEPSNERHFIGANTDAGKLLFFSSSLALVESFRPDSKKDTPDYYSVYSNGVFECLQAWSNRYSSISTYSIGRSSLKNQINLLADSKIIKNSDSKAVEIEISMPYYPESLVFEYPSEFSELHNKPFTNGNPAFFIETSKTMNDEGISWEMYPNVITTGVPGPAIEKDIFTGSTVRFIIKFPKLDLPDSAYFIPNKCSIEYKVRTEHIFSLSFERDEDKGFDFLYFSPNRGVDYIRGEDVTWEGTDCWKTSRFSDFKNTYPVSALETAILQAGYDGTPKEHRFALIGFRFHLTIRMPLKDAKLYASGTIEGFDSSSQLQGNSVIPSINGLLKSVNMLSGDSNDYDYSAEAIGELNEIKYGCVIINEAAKFRDKLRSFAEESATLVKFSPIENKFLVKSVSRQFDEENIPITIEMDAIVLENNLFDFKMESPHRDDVLKGISLSWGKDTVSGKYGHSFVFDSQGFFIDDEYCSLPLDSVIGDKWNPVKYRLRINSNLNIGTTKSINCEWITDLAGAELFAYNYLCWNCAPLRKAQVNCIFPVLKEKYKVDIGDFVSFNLPGYPPKFAKTAWVITGMQDDLDSMVTSLELLEVWNMQVARSGNFLLLENGGNIFTETEERKIKLEGLNG